MRLSLALHALVLALVAVVYAPFAHASAIDVSAVVTDIGAQAAPIVLIGGAALLLYVLRGSFQQLREVLFGGYHTDDGYYVSRAKAAAEQLEYEREEAAREASNAEFLANGGMAQVYLERLAATLAAEDAANGVEWRDVGTGKSNLDYEADVRADLNAGTAYAGDLSPTYREATIEESASWARVNDAADAGEAAAYEAGLHGHAVDKAGWTTEQHIAFDDGKDQAHENYLASIGTSSAANKAARGKD